MSANILLFYVQSLGVQPIPFGLGDSLMFGNENVSWIIYADNIALIVGQPWQTHKHGP